MKKIKIIIAAFLSIFLTASCASGSTAKDDDIEVVTSFYPIYVIAENVIGNTEGISLKNMAQPQTGCLHDYQLSTGDMKKLSTADIFVINGGGMESFLDNALELFPELNIVDTSDGVTELLNEHSEHDGHNHEENSHFWILPSNAAVQAQNICSALSALCPDKSGVFENNTEIFIKKLNSLESFDGNGIKACVFNEAFDYLELSYGMDIVLCVEMDENETPSAKELAEIISTVNENHIDLLIAADDASKLLAETIERETDAKVIVLDPVLTGDYSPERYVNAMNENARILKGSVKK